MQHIDPAVKARAQMSTTPCESQEAIPALLVVRSQAHLPRSHARALRDLLHSQQRCQGNTESRAKQSARNRVRPDSEDCPKQSGCRIEAERVRYFAMMSRLAQRSAIGSADSYPHVWVHGIHTFGSISRKMSILMHETRSDGIAA